MGGGRESSAIDRTTFGGKAPFPILSDIQRTIGRLRSVVNA